MKDEAWLRAETPATRRASTIQKPVVAAKLLKRAKSPVIVVGHEAAEGEGSRVPPEPGSSGGEGGPSGAEAPVLDSVIRIARATGAPVIGTGGISRELGRRGFTTAIVMSAMEAGDRLMDGTWQPVPGKNPPDYAFFLGIPFPVASVIEAGLASFARSHLRVISLDRLYHPHCDLSFPNQSGEEWVKNLVAIAREVEKK